jgi:cytosine/uracil/thiamine/allantoin permease
MTYEAKLKRQEIIYKRKKDKARLKANKLKLKKEINDIINEQKGDIEEEKVPTSKKIFYILFINCTILEIYSMWAMIHLNDLSALTTLISSIIGETMSYAIYCLKSYFGKKEEENMKFQREIEIERLDIDGNESEVNDDDCN